MKVAIAELEKSQRQKQKEDPDYRNRTDLYYNLTLGDATLRLQNLTRQDAGLCVCEVWSEGHSPHAEGSVSLSVACKLQCFLVSKMDKNELI